jgi:Thiamine-binding protein
MLMELSVIPLGRGRSTSADVADLVQIIDASSLDYRLTAAGTIRHFPTPGARPMQGCKGQRTCWS